MPWGQGRQVNVAAAPRSGSWLGREPGPALADLSGQPDGAHDAREASPGKRAFYAGGAAAGRDPWLPQPVLAILLSVLDQWQGGHLLVLEQVRRADLNRFGPAPCGKDHRFVLEHLLIDVER